MIPFFILASFLVMGCTVAAFRVRRPLWRYPLMFTTLFLALYGTYSATEHVCNFRYYSGYIRQNLRYTDYLYSKAKLGDFESISNAVVFFSENMEKYPESFTNMIETVNTILIRDSTNADQNTSAPVPAEPRN